MDSVEVALPATAAGGPIPPEPITSFEQLDLSPPLLRAVQKAGWQTPTPIQLDSIPVALAGRDLIACAQTGTGKTGAFALPILKRLKEGAGPSALVLTPTRELAVQVAEHFEELAKFSQCKIVRVYGGVSIDVQAKRLASGVDVVVATPGRLLDQMRRRNVHFKKLQFLVLDEADRMLDMGFAPDIRRILTFLPKKRQSMLFSATMPVGIRALAGAALTDPVTVEVGRRAAPAEGIEHLAYRVSKSRKMDLLLHILREREYGRLLLFARTRQDVNVLAQMLTRERFSIDLIHSDRRQNEREKALSDFRRGKTQILVATDVAARGLDIEGITYVLNYNVPDNPEDYIHRIGRTARADADGWAVTLVTLDEEHMLKAIERFIGMEIAKGREESFDYGDFAYVLDLENRKPSAPSLSRRGRGRSFRRR
ncbi:MAG: DEAD/DEAH box helicase [Nitrospinota bacterium]|jgi:ATP-dependent RNA helicase RhlE|nr:DEAD/DEAH box helicase [Nitrospinota bacterium]